MTKQIFIETVYGCYRPCNTPCDARNHLVRMMSPHLFEDLLAEIPLDVNVVCHGRGDPGLYDWHDVKITRPCEACVVWIPQDNIDGLFTVTRVLPTGGDPTHVNPRHALCVCTNVGDLDSAIKWFVNSTCESLMLRSCEPVPFASVEYARGCAIARGVKVEWRSTFDRANGDIPQPLIRIESKSLDNLVASRCFNTMPQTTSISEVLSWLDGPRINCSTVCGQGSSWRMILVK